MTEETQTAIAHEAPRAQQTSKIRVLLADDHTILLAGVRRLLPDVRVLVLTMHENEEYLFQVLRAGASGYMLKEAADTELISAIRIINNGSFYLSSSAQSMMVGDYLQRVRSGEERDSYSELTEREREILKHVAEGYTNNQIAERLFISPKTVDTHRTHIMDKLNLHSRAELVKYAMRRGLLEDS